MSESSGLAKTAGRLGALACAVGVVMFLSGLFVAPRSFVIIGICLMAVSLIGFIFEEQSQMEG